MLILRTKTTTVEMRAQIQSVVLAEDNNQAEKEEGRSIKVGGSQSCIGLTRNSKQDRQHSQAIASSGSILLLG